MAEGVGIAFFNEDNPKRYMKYIGQWEGGLFSGRGILFCWDGSSYDGQWAEGKKKGQGTLTYGDESDKFRYDGKFVDDKFHG